MAVFLLLLLLGASAFPQVLGSGDRIEICGADIRLGMTQSAVLGDTSSECHAVQVPGSDTWSLRERTGRIAGVVAFSSGRVWEVRKSWLPSDRYGVVDVTRAIVMAAQATLQKKESVTAVVSSVTKREPNAVTSYLQVALPGGRELRVHLLETVGASSGGTPSVVGVEEVLSVRP